MLPISGYRIFTLPLMYNTQRDKVITIKIVLIVVFIQNFEFKKIILKFARK